MPIEKSFTITIRFIDSRYEGIKLGYLAYRSDNCWQEPEVIRFSKVSILA
jgi:hypothetical protein